jgi:hypothetical protein
MREAAWELTAVDGVQMVNIVFGPSDIIAYVILPEESTSIDLIAERIGRIDGVHSVRPNVVLETVKFETRHACIPIVSGPISFPNHFPVAQKVSRCGRGAGAPLACSSTSGTLGRVPGPSWVRLGSRCAGG